MSFLLFNFYDKTDTNVRKLLKKLNLIFRNSEAKKKPKFYLESVKSKDSDQPQKED